MVAGSKRADEVGSPSTMRTALVGGGPALSFAVLQEIEGRETGLDLRLRLRLDNLTDEEYQTQLGLPGPSRSIRVGPHYRLEGP